MKNYIAYGTYQRATSGYPIRALNPRLIVRLIRRKFKPSARRDRKLREARHAAFRGAIDIWRSELETLRQFKL